MFDVTWQFLLGLVTSMAVLQAALLLLARGLGLRIHRHAVVVGLVLPCLVVSCYMVNDQLLFPAVVVARTLPDSPEEVTDQRHNVLNDAVFQFIPWEHEVRRAFSEGRLPLWSDQLGGGSSPWSNPQACVLSPLVMLARLGPLEHHFLMALALKILAAFQGAWLLTRLLGGWRNAALLAGTSFALGGGVMAWALFPHTATVVWVPWLVVATIRVVRRPNSRHVGVTAIVAAALFVAGQPEVALGGGLLAGVCGLSLARRWRSSFRGFAYAAAAAALRAALAAPHLLPFAQFVPHTERYHQKMLSAKPSITAHWDRPASWVSRPHLRFALSATNPRLSGVPYSNEDYKPAHGLTYCGLLAFAGIFMAAFGRMRRAVPFIAFSVVSFLLAAKFAPLRYLADGVPKLQIVDFIRFFGVVSLCLSTAGGLGLTLLLRRRPAAFPLLGLMCAAAVSLLVARPTAVVTLWVLLIAAAAVTLIRPRLGFAALAIIAMADLGPWALSMLPQGNPTLFYPNTPSISALRQQVAAAGGCRVAGSGNVLYPGLLAMYGLEDVRYHDPMADQDYVLVLGTVHQFHDPGKPYSYFSSFQHTERPLLDFLNVGVVVAHRSQPLPPGHFERVEVEDLGELQIYRNPRVLPRWFLPVRAVIVDESEVLAAIAEQENPRIVILNRDEVGAWRPAQQDWQPGAVEPIATSPGQAELRIAGHGERLLATSLPQPVGWSAHSGDRRLRTITVNNAFLGVIVPPGVDAVHLRFLPPGLPAGVVLWLIATSVVFGLLVRDRFFRSGP